MKREERPERSESQTPRRNPWEPQKRESQESPQVRKPEDEARAKGGEPGETPETGGVRSRAKEGLEKGRGHCRETRDKRL